MIEYEDMCFPPGLNFYTVKDILLSFPVSLDRKCKNLLRFPNYRKPNQGHRIHIAMDIPGLRNVGPGVDKPLWKRIFGRSMRTWLSITNSGQKKHVHCPLSSAHCQCLLLNIIVVSCSNANLCCTIHCAGGSQSLKPLKEFPCQPFFLFGLVGDIYSLPHAKRMTLEFSQTLSLPTWVGWRNLHSAPWRRHTCSNTWRSISTFISVSYWRSPLSRNTLKTIERHGQSQHWKSWHSKRTKEQVCKRKGTREMLQKHVLSLTFKKHLLNSTINKISLEISRSILGLVSANMNTRSESRKSMKHWRQSLNELHGKREETLWKTRTRNNDCTSPRCAHTRLWIVAVISGPGAKGILVTRNPVIQNPVTKILQPQESMLWNVEEAGWVENR